MPQPHKFVFKLRENNFVAGGAAPKKVTVIPPPLSGQLQLWPRVGR